MNFSWRFAASALLVLLVALSAEHTAHGRARRESVLLRAPSTPRRALALLLVVLASALYGASLYAAVGTLLLVPLLLVSRRPPAAKALPLGHFQPVTRARLQESRAARAVRGSWLDGSTRLGALCLLLFVLALLLLPGAYDIADEPYGFALLCAVPSWFIGAAQRWPRSFDERLGLLAGALAESTLHGYAFRLLAYASDGEVLTEPRSRVLFRARYPGLLRVDALVDTRRDCPPFVLRAILQRGSASERWIARSLRGVSRSEGLAGGRVALFWSVADFDGGIEALFALLDRESQRVVERLTLPAAQTA